MSPVEAVMMLGLLVVVLLGAAQYAEAREIRRMLESLSRGEAARAMLGRGDVQVREALSGPGPSAQGGNAPGASPPAEPAPAERATRPDPAPGGVGALSLPNYPDRDRLPAITIDDPPDSDKAPAQGPELPDDRRGILPPASPSRGPADSGPAIELGDVGAPPDLAKLGLGLDDADRMQADQAPDSAPPSIKRSHRPPPHRPSRPIEARTIPGIRAASGRPPAPEPADGEDERPSDEPTQVIKRVKGLPPAPPKPLVSRGAFSGPPVDEDERSTVEIAPAGGAKPSAS